MALPVAFCVVMMPCSEAVIALSGMFACVGAPSIGWKDMEGENRKSDNCYLRFKST